MDPEHTDEIAKTCRILVNRDQSIPRSWLTRDAKRPTDRPPSKKSVNLIEENQQLMKQLGEKQEVINHQDGLIDQLKEKIRLLQKKCETQRYELKALKEQKERDLSSHPSLSNSTNSSPLSSIGDVRYPDLELWNVDNHIEDLRQRLEEQLSMEQFR
jgi:hypothetical protein